MFGKKRKQKKWQEELLRQYDQGKVLQVDNGIDNKDYLSKKSE